MHLIVCMSFFEAGPVTRAAVPLAQLANNPDPNPIPITYPDPNLLTLTLTLTLTF